MLHSISFKTAAVAIVYLLVSEAAAENYGTSIGRCRKIGERAIGAPGKPYVPFLPCCDRTAKIVAVKSKGWGKFCMRHRRHKYRLPCRKNGERVVGAPGKPYIPYAPCCDPAARHVEDVSLGWGKFCFVPLPVPPTPSATTSPVVQLQCYETGKEVLSLAKSGEYMKLACCDENAVLVSYGKYQSCRILDEEPGSPHSSPHPSPGGPTISSPEPSSEPTPNPLPSASASPQVSSPEPSAEGTPDATPAESSAPVPTSTPNPSPAESPQATPVPTPTATPSPGESPQASPEESFAPTPSASPIDSADPCRGLRSVRKEVRDMTDDEMKAYEEAINILRDNGEWLRFAQIHTGSGQVGNNFQQAHRGAYFLPWHRAMLFEMEIALNNFRPEGTPQISIPYFDWTFSANNISSSSAFPNRFGPFLGHGIAQPIPKAYVSGDLSPYTTSHTTEHEVIRLHELTGGASGPPFQLATRDVLNTAITSNPSYASYAEVLEGFHDTPHVAIGGDMLSVPTASNDPIFFSHHAFIDKEYDTWQRRWPDSGFGGVHPYPEVGDPQPASVSTEMFPFEATVETIIGEYTKCVTYLPPVNAAQNPGAFSAAGPPGAAAAAAPVSQMPVPVQNDAPPILTEDPVATETPPPDGLKRDLPPVAQGAFEASDGTKVDTIAEKRDLQRTVAERKVNEPESYRQDLLVAEARRDSIVIASEVTGNSAGGVERLKTSVEVLMLKLGVNLKEDAGRIGPMPIEEIVAEGMAELEALDSGKGLEELPGNDDDSDVAEVATS